MEKKDVLEKVKEVLAAPSCCAELKEVCREYLEAVNTPKEREVGKKLIAELKEDVQTLDEVLPFFSSKAGAEFFGEERAQIMVEEAKKLKAAGKKYCFCPACTAGSEILAHKDLL